MKVLFVCLGNICRSPMAQGIMESKMKQNNLDWFIDSAGTSGWHDGEPPDKRAITASKNFGIDISSQISRKISVSDLDYFDKIVVMDSSNFQDVKRLCKNDSQSSKIELMMNYHQPHKNIGVPDPYYDNTFKEVFLLLESAIEAMIQKLKYDQT